MVNENTQEENLDFAKSEGPSENKGCEFALHGVYIDNGMPRESDNNMLHFASFEQYENVLEELEADVEAYEDAFVNAYPNLSDDDLDDIEESTGFNDQQPMIDLEVTHSFQSLRKVMLAAEEAWLDQSDQPGWSWDDDPTDKAIIEGIEQTLWNPYHEIVICNMIYKYVDGGLLHIPIDHRFASDILDAANDGMTIEDLVREFGGTQSDNLKDQIVTELFVQVTPEDTVSCVFKENRQKRFVHPNNSRRSVKAKHVIRTWAYWKVYKAVTKSYKYKRGKWRSRRTTISAGLDGNIHDPQLGCPSMVYINKRTTRKKRKRREEAHRIPNGTIIVARIGINRGELKSTHYQDTHWNYYVID